MPPNWSSTSFDILDENVYRTVLMMKELHPQILRR